MAKKVEYVSYKKLLIIGTKGAGKTTLAKTFQDNNSNEEETKPSESKKIKFYNIMLNIIIYLFK